MECAYTALLLEFKKFSPFLHVTARYSEKKYYETQGLKSFRMAIKECVISLTKNFVTTKVIIIIFFFKFGKLINFIIRGFYT